MLHVYTSTIYGVKKLKLDSTFNVMDITVKSGNKIFAPSWDIVMDWKNGLINQATYTKEYIRLMRISFKEHKKEWLDVLKQDKIILCCYCHNGDFCHRYILVDLFIKTAKYYGIDVKYEGELTA